MEREASPTLAEANERFIDVMRQKCDMSEEIRSVDKEIMALEAKRRKLAQQQSELYSGPWEVAVKSISKAWNRRMFQYMQHTIPRELRDMIYTCLWDDESIYQIHTALMMCLDGSKNDYLTMRPPYLDPEFVGKEAALEVAESWYKAASEVITEVFMIRKPEQLEYLICGDPFFLGLDSSSIVKGILVEISIAKLAHPTDNPSSKHRFIELLLKIKRKAGFNLTIILTQKYIRLRSWPQVFDSLRKVVDVFEKEGAHLSVSFQYDNYALYPPLELDLLGPIKDPDSNWRAEAMEKLDSDSRIRERHRLYCNEDKSDFDSNNEDYHCTSESEFYYAVGRSPSYGGVESPDLTNVDSDAEEDPESYDPYDYADLYYGYGGLGDYWY